MLLPAAILRKYRWTLWNYFTRRIQPSAQMQVCTGCKVVVDTKKTKIACQRSRSCFTLIYSRLRARVGTCQSPTYQLNSHSLAPNLFKRFLLRPKSSTHDNLIINRPASTLVVWCLNWLNRCEWKWHVSRKLYEARSRCNWHSSLLINVIAVSGRLKQTWHAWLNILAELTRVR